MEKMVFYQKHTPWQNNKFRFFRWFRCIKEKKKLLKKLKLKRLVKEKLYLG